MYSNCLFEALKAKIKHPNTVQILFLKGGVFGKYSHFMWREADKVKHAYNPKINWWNIWLFKPSFKVNSFDAFEAYILDCIKNLPYKEKLKYANKFNLRSSQIPGVLDWAAYLPNLDLKPKKEDYEYLLKVLRKGIPIKVISDKEISIKAFEDLREGMQYKFITPFDSDYVALNGYLKSKKLSYELGD